MATKTEASQEQSKGLKYGLDAEVVKKKLEAAKKNNLVLAVVRNAGEARDGRKRVPRFSQFLMSANEQEWNTFLSNEASIWISEILHLPTGWIDPTKDEKKFERILEPEF